MKSDWILVVLAVLLIFIVWLQENRSHNLSASQNLQLKSVQSDPPECKATGEISKLPAISVVVNGEDNFLSTITSIKSFQTLTPRPPILIFGHSLPLAQIEEIRILLGVVYHDAMETLVTYPSKAPFASSMTYRLYQFAANVFGATLGISPGVVVTNDTLLIDVLSQGCELVSGYSNYSAHFVLRKDVFEPPSNMRRRENLLRIGLNHDGRHSLPKCDRRPREDVLYNMEYVRRNITICDDSETGDGGCHDENPIFDAATNETYALLLASTSKNVSGIDDIPLLTTFFPSLKLSIDTPISRNYRYNIYIGYDRFDKIYGNQFLRLELLRRAREIFAGLPVRLTFIPGPNTRRLTFVWNELYEVALRDRTNSFFYQLNDDVELLTVDWTTAIAELFRKTDGFGMACPNDIRWRCGICTQAVVTRKHYEVFKFFYPQEFADLQSDLWLTLIYKQPESCLLQVKIRNTKGKGTRYTQCHHGNFYGHVLAKYEPILQRYKEKMVSSIQ